MAGEATDERAWFLKNCASNRKRGAKCCKGCDREDMMKVLREALPILRRASAYFAHANATVSQREADALIPSIATLLKEAGGGE